MGSERFVQWKEFSSSAKEEDCLSQQQTMPYSYGEVR